MSNPPARLSLKIRVGWAVGSVLTTTLIFITNSFFLRFITDYVGLTAGIAATLLALPKLCDIIIYPAMGVISDHMPPRFGRRRPFLLGGGLLGALSLVMMFTIPAGLPPLGKAAFLLAALICGSLANASFTVPYLAMPAEMTSSPTERSSLMSLRVYILSGSQFVAGGLCPVLVQLFGGGAQAYSLMAIVMAVYLAVVAWVCFAWTRDAPATQLSVQHKGQFWSSLPTMFASRSYVALLLCKYFFLIGTTAHTATATFYVKYVMHAGDAVLGLFLLFYSIGMVASQPLWLWIGKRIGKAGCFSVAAALYAGISLTWAGMQPHLPQGLFMVLSFANGFGAGGCVLMSQSMAPDAVDDDFRIRGIRREASLVSFIALAEKGASASGLMLVGFVLSWFHYAAPAHGQSLSAAAQHGIVVAFGVVPAVFFGLGAAWLLLRGRSNTPMAAVPATVEAGA